MATITLNGVETEIDAPPDMPLLWAIRDIVGLTGSKYGCGAGLCGACTVHVDGMATRSCVTSLEAVEGAAVTTIEGLSEDGSHPVQVAWRELNVPQCGFCIPGMVMAAAVLLKKNRNPSEDDIKEAITNLCRCGVYPRIVEAVMRAARVQRGDETIDAGASPGIDPASAARLVPALTPGGGQPR